MTTLIHVNELEEVPLRTIAAVLNSLYPPPPPHTHTHTQNEDFNTRFESEEVPLTTAHFRPFYPTHHGHDDANTRSKFAVGTCNDQRNFKFPLTPPQNKDGRILYIRIQYKQKKYLPFQ